MIWANFARFQMPKGKMATRVEQQYIAIDLENTQSNSDLCWVVLSSAGTVQV